MMRILLAVHHELTQDAGAPGVTMRLRSAYQDAGHQVQLLSHDDLPARLSRIQKSLLFPWLVARESLRMSRQSGLDVLDCTTGDIWPSASIPRLRSNCLLVTRSHGLEHGVHDLTLAESKRTESALPWKYPIYHGGFRLWEVQRSMQVSDVTLLLNDADRICAVDRLGVARAKAHIVHNGISEYFLDLPTPASAGTKDLKIAFVGSYLTRKGTEGIEAAMNARLRNRPHWRMTFFGTNLSEREVLGRFDPEVRSQLRVVPRYENPDLPHLLAGQQILLFPSLFEGQPIALLEGMACGLAPVVSDISALRAVTSEHNSMTIRPGVSEDILTSLDALDRDRDLLQRLALDAQRSARTHNWPAIADRQLLLFSQQLEAKRRQAS